MVWYHSTGENPDVQIHASRRHHASDRLLPAGIILALGCPVAIHDDGPLHHARGPAQTADEMPVRVVDRLDAFAFLRQIPASDRLVVADAEEVLAARVEDEGADPVVVPDERLDRRASRVPDLDALVPGAGGEVFARAAGWGRFLQSR